uniref:Uncharacterized protein n=1 Tax=Vespula pensylvanica TaxID=30213 RepID=A0A834NQ93_VESPE|nr:hypothetical protein H0235_012087 [Vespula pensylvanica]
MEHTVHAESYYKGNSPTPLCIHADASVSCKSNNSEQRNSAPDRPEGRPTSWEDQRVEFLWLQPVAG